MAVRTVFRLLPTHRTRFQPRLHDWTRSECLGSLATAQLRAPTREVASFSSETLQCARLGRSYGSSYITCPVGQNGDGDTGGKNCSLTLLSVVAFSFFTKSDDAEDGAKKEEDEIVMLLKRAKLSIMREELEAASVYLHQAIRLAHRSHNNQAIIYTYSLMANLALVQGQLTNAEKLFKATMSFLLSGGAPEDDNAVVEMSLKLATIYGSQNKHELAEHGFQFCIDSLEAKLKKQKDLPPDALSDEERKDTHLLLGLCLDCRARYLTDRRHLDQARLDYQRALQICREEQGEAHPQTLVLMNDLATVLDMQGRYEEALREVKRAVELGKEAGHPDQHVLLVNMAGILLHQGQLAESGRLYREALALAQAAGDGGAVEQVQEGLKDLEDKRNRPTDEV